MELKQIKALVTEETGKINVKKRLIERLTGEMDELSTLVDTLKEGMLTAYSPADEQMLAAWGTLGRRDAALMRIPEPRRSMHNTMTLFGLQCLQTYLRHFLKRLVEMLDEDEARLSRLQAEAAKVPETQPQPAASTPAPSSPGDSPSTAAASSEPAAAADKKPAVKLRRKRGARDRGAQYNRVEAPTRRRK